MKTFFAPLMAALALTLFTSNPAFSQGPAQPTSLFEMIGGIIIGGLFVLIIAILACPDLTTAIYNLFSKKHRL